MEDCALEGAAESMAFLAEVHAGLSVQVDCTLARVDARAVETEAATLGALEG